MKMTYYVKHISHVLLALSIIGLSTTASAGSNNGGWVNTNPFIDLFSRDAMGNLSADKKSYKTGLSSFSKGHNVGYVTGANNRWNTMLK